MALEQLKEFDLHKSLLWLVAHVGSVTAAVTLVLAWWRRKGRLHMRGLRSRVRYMALDCLQWAVAHRFSPSRLYWGVRYFRDWEVSVTLREGLRKAGLPVDDPAWSRRLVAELGEAVRDKAFKSFDHVPEDLEVRPPIADEVDECRRIESAADEAQSRGWEALSEALRAKFEPSSTAVFYQAICDLWVEKTQAVVLNQVFHQGGRLLQDLGQVKTEVETLPVQLDEIRAELSQLRESLKVVPLEPASTKDGAEVPIVYSSRRATSERAIWWVKLAFGLTVVNLLVTTIVGWLACLGRG